MSSLQADFDDLRAKIRHGRDVGQAGFEPVYYLVFPPKDIVTVKRKTLAWLSRLRQDGWEVTHISMTDEVLSILRKDPRRPLWLAGDRKSPLDWKRTNGSLQNALTVNDPLRKRLEEILASVANKPNSLLLFSDLEALHPYLRIGAIEAQLIGQFKVPSIFLYPGVRAGQTRLKFLGFYPEDGNYRSVHIGG